MLPGEAPVVDELLVRNELQKRGVNASSEWIRQAIQHVFSTTSTWPTATTPPQQQIADKVFSLYLLADLRTLAEKPLLPATKDTPHDEWLFGDRPSRPVQLSSSNNNNSNSSGGGVILQLLHIQDISISSLKMLELCEALGVAGDQPGGFQVGKALPRGMCMLELTDGFRKISAIEMEPIHGIGIEMKLGVKILVKSVQVRHGMLQLSNTNAQILGGEVASMNRHPRRLVIINQMKKNLKIPEDPLPLMPSTPPIANAPQQPGTHAATTSTMNGSGATSTAASSGGFLTFGNAKAPRTSPTSSSQRTTNPMQGWSTSTSAVGANDSIPANAPRVNPLLFKPESAAITGFKTSTPSNVLDRRDPQQQQHAWTPVNRKRPADQVDEKEETELDSRAFQWNADDAWGGIEPEPDWGQFDNSFDMDSLDQPGALDSTRGKETARASPTPTKRDAETTPSGLAASKGKPAVVIDQHGKKLSPAFASTIPSTQRQRLSLKRPGRVVRDSPPVVKVDESELVPGAKLVKREKSPISSDGDVANEFERRLSVTRDLNDSDAIPTDDGERSDTSMKSVKRENRSETQRLATRQASFTAFATKATAILTDWMKPATVKSERSSRQASVVDLLSDEETLDLAVDHPMDEEDLTAQEREELERATRESLRVHQEHMASTQPVEDSNNRYRISSSSQQDDDHHHHHMAADFGNIEQFDIRGLDVNAFAGLVGDYHDDDPAQHELPTQVLPPSQNRQNPPLQPDPPQQPMPRHPTPKQAPAYRQISRPSSSTSSNDGGGSGGGSGNGSQRSNDPLDDGLVKVKQEKTLFEMDDTEDEDDLALLNGAGVHIKKEVIPLVPLSDVLSSLEKGLEVRAKGRLIKMGKFSLTTLGASLVVFMVPPNDSPNSSSRLEAQLESGVVEKLLGMSSTAFASLVERKQNDTARETVNAMKQSLMDVELVECRFQGLRKQIPVVREFTILGRK